MALFSSSLMIWPSLPMPLTMLTWFSSMVMIGFRSSPSYFLFRGRHLPTTWTVTEPLFLSFMAAAAAAKAMVLCVVLYCWLLGLPARRRPAALRRNQLRSVFRAPPAGESSAQARDDSGVVGGKTRKRAVLSLRHAADASPPEAWGALRKAIN